MKLIALWSSKHLSAARMIIAFCHISLACLACFVGISLQEYDVLLSVEMFWIASGVFGAIFIICNRMGYRSISFYKRKTLDVTVIICSFIMITVLSNQKNVTQLSTFPSATGSFPTHLSAPVKQPTFKDFRKQWKELKSLVKKNKPSAGAIIGAILLGLLLTALVASASCSLACNGQDALALIVLLGGLTGIFFLIRLLLRPKQQPKSSTTNADNALGT
jgi:hypothetical protein